jgi:hypothetical protein
MGPTPHEVLLKSRTQEVLLMSRWKRLKVDDVLFAGREIKSDHGATSVVAPGIRDREYRVGGGCDRGYAHSHRQASDYVARNEKGRVGLGR